MRKVCGVFAEGVFLGVTPSAREMHYRYLWGNMTAEGVPHKSTPSAKGEHTFRKTRHFGGNTLLKTPKSSENNPKPKKQAPISPESSGWDGLKV